MLDFLGWVGRIFAQGWIRWLMLSLLTAGLGYAGGRYLTPPKVVVQIQTKTETRVVTVRIKDAQRQVHVVRIVTPTPLGPLITTTTDANTTTETTTKANSDAQTVTSKVTTTYNRPDWRIGAMGGVLILPGSAPSWLVGVQVERRILGPISIGAWVMGGPKAGAVGGLLNVEF